VLSAFNDWVMSEYGAKAKTKISEDGHKLCRLKGCGLRGVAQVFNRVDAVRVKDVDSVILDGGGLRIIWTGSGVTSELLSLCVKRKIKVVPSGFVYHSQSWGLKDARSRMRVTKQRLTAWHLQYYSCGGDLVLKWIEGQRSPVWLCRRCGLYLDPVPPFAKAPFFLYNRSELSGRIYQEAHRVRGSKAQRLKGSKRKKVRFWSLAVCLAQKVARTKGREQTLENSEEAKEIREPDHRTLADFLPIDSESDPPDPLYK